MSETTVRPIASRNAKLGEPRGKKPNSVELCFSLSVLRRTSPPLDPLDLRCLLPYDPQPRNAYASISKKRKRLMTVGSPHPEEPISPDLTVEGSGHFTGEATGAIF